MGTLILGCLFFSFLCRIHSCTRVNVPYVRGERYADDTVEKNAIFWFGEVKSDLNHVQVRTSYDLYKWTIRLDVFDRRLRFSLSASDCNELKEWDGISMYVDYSGQTAVLSNSSLMVTRMFSSVQTSLFDRCLGDGTGGSWSYGTNDMFDLTIFEGHMGDVNVDVDGRGYNQYWYFPWSTLGFDGEPDVGESIRVAIELHDNDDGITPTGIGIQVWPPGMNKNDISTWGELVFGVLGWNEPTNVVVASEETFQIRNNDTIFAPSINVGGGIGHLCALNGPFDIWTEWGDFTYWNFPANFDGDFVVHNQHDIADWPCAAKSFLRFPLGTLDPSKVVKSATLQIYHWGGSNPQNAHKTYLQIASLTSTWDEETITWNNSPPPEEFNVETSGINTIVQVSHDEMPGTPYEIDLTIPVSEAHEDGHDTITFVLFSADSEQDSGKYFDGHEAGVEYARPTLTVNMVEGQAGTRYQKHNIPPVPGDIVELNESCSYELGIFFVGILIFLL